MSKVKYNLTVSSNQFYFKVQNHRQGVDWDDKIWHRQEQWQGRSIGAWGM